MSREDLEKLALSKCEAEIFYELMDEVDNASDEELQKIIEYADNELLNFKKDL